MLSVGAIHFEDRFYTHKKVGTCCAHGGCLGWLAVEQPRSALTGPPLTFLGGNHSSPLVGVTISGTVSIFRSGVVFAGQRALTNESLLISTQLR